MADEAKTDEGQDEDTDATTDTGGQPGQGERVSAPSGVQFTAQQQDYLNKLLADERRAALRRYKDSDEYKSLVARAEAANELDTLRADNSKLRAEKASGVAAAENALVRAQLTAVMSQRGIPTERIADALIIADKSGVKADLAEGTVTGAEEAVQALVESRPWLVGPGIAPTTTQQSRPAPNLNGGTHGSPATDEARIGQAMQEMAARGWGRI